MVDFTTLHPFDFDRNLFNFYGQGNGPIWLNYPSCTGNEERLLECRAPHIGNHNCGHNDDAGVVCSGISLTAY